VQATREGADALARELARWLGELASNSSQSIAICKEK
jgi:hypothetical protein